MISSMRCLSFLCIFIYLSFSSISWRPRFLFLTVHPCMWQIDRHFSTFLVPDMTIEKLQKVATTHVDAHFKAKWLRWWNSPADVKDKNRFPSSLPLREKVLENWLNKASFWAQVHLYSYGWFHMRIARPSMLFLKSSLRVLFRLLVRLRLLVSFWFMRGVTCVLLGLASYF